MALTIASLSQYQFPLYGGVEFTITVDAGTPLTLGGSYAVYLGPAGSAVDTPCYGGEQGYGYACYPETVTTLKAVSPLLDRASGLYVTIVGPGGTGLIGGGAPAITAIEQSFCDMLWVIRKHWPDWYETGPRSLQDEPRQDV